MTIIFLYFEGGRSWSARLIFKVENQFPIGNLGFADWTEIFGEATLTAALLDRLTHKAHIITCAWESFRLKESLKRKGGGLPGEKRLPRMKGVQRIGKKKYRLWIMPHLRIRHTADLSTGAWKTHTAEFSTLPTIPAAILYSLCYKL